MLLRKKQNLFSPEKKMTFVHLGLNVYNLDKLFWFDILLKNEKVEVYACYSFASSIVYLDAKSLDDAKQIIELTLPFDCFVCIPHTNLYRYVNTQKAFYYDVDEHSLVFPSIEPIPIEYQSSWNFKTTKLFPSKLINMTQVEDFKIWISEDKLSIYAYFTVGKCYSPYKVKSILMGNMEELQYQLHQLTLK